MRWIGAVVLLLVLSGCGDGRHELLFVRTADGLSVVDASGGRTLFTATGAVPSRDWSRMLRAEPDGPRTRLSVLDPSTGAVSGTRTVDGGLDVRAVSSDGLSVALAPPGGYANGRPTTPVVVSGPRSSRRYDLEGNYEPEAFSLDRSTLFVIEYMPALAPDRYRVRQLDLGTGEVSGVYSIDKYIQEAMRGTARTQAPAPDGRRLYTLYGTGDRSFVHVLALDEKWAHCIDLPPMFGKGAEQDMALAVSPDSSRLHVADANAGLVGVFETATHAIVRTVRIDLPGHGPVRLAATHDRIYVGRDGRVVAIDASSLARTRAWSVPGVVSGIQAADDSVYVALGDRIAVLDVRSGRVLRTLRGPGMTGIEQLGLGGSPVGSRAALTCACSIG
ncbi:MAG: hypothetical protein WD826_08690 [Actinomycetota bacterium]